MPELSAPSALPAGPAEAGSNLTTSQYLMWLGQAVHPEVPLYNMVFTFDVAGTLEPELFGQAFQALVDRSDALRSVVTLGGQGPELHVRPSLPARLDVVDLSAAPDVDAACAAWVEERRTRQLALDEALFDTALLKLADDRYVWYLNQHHLITDIWTVALLYRHLEAFYRLACAGRLAEAPALPPFADYAAHERAFRGSARHEQAEAYWQDLRGTLPGPPQLYGQQAARETTQTARVRRTLGDEAAARLATLVQRPDVRALTPHLTRYSIFAAVLFAYLHRVSGQRDLALGTPTHNRPTAAFKETLGLFIEMFPFRAEVKEGDTFASLIKKVQAEALRLFRHALPGTSSAAANRSYNVVLNYLPVAFGPTFDGRPMTSTWVHSGHGDSRHHLRLQVHDLDERGTTHLLFDFNAELFDAPQREAAADQFVRLLEAALADPGQPVGAPSLLGAAEREQMLAFGRPAPAPPTPPTVLDLFEAQAERTPEATAIADGEHTTTYRALRTSAEQLARRLRRHGVGAGARVGLYLGRSAEAVTAILAVLKAGGTYVPLDRRHPVARQAATLRDAQVRVLLTHGAPPPPLPDLAGEVLDMATMPDERTDVAAAVDDRPTPGQAAYVLYTSGSTGQPKGVVVDHAALAHYLIWAREAYLPGQPVNMPLFTSLAVDLTVTSLFLPLLTGGRVVVHDEAADPATLLAGIVRAGDLDLIKMTPSHVMLIRHVQAPTGRVQGVILGGEDLKTAVAQRVLQTFGARTAVYNEYGPTEATVGCVVHRFDPERDVGASVPIGQPAAQARLYVLDETYNLVPPRVTGELYVAGPGLARGYLHQPEQTAERFGADPFHPGERMYRTGDVVRWRPAGILDYLGRMDDQVQVRGARVELGEVEAALQAYPAVEAAVAAVATLTRAGEEAVRHCTRCGLPSNYPGASFDEAGLCHLCQAFDRYEARAQQYFRGMDDLRALFDASRTQHRASTYDCLMLLSGGKDSTYALARLVEMGLRVLTFTLDNGYISDGAKANIRRVTGELGVDHVFGETPAMNAIFADSLRRFSNVCNGCFKTIYTLALQEARKRGIPIIVTGLSRGQFFETRLTESLFLDDDIDADRIDLVVLEARKAYHRVDDAVHRLLDVEALQDDALFEQIRFVDFYRYCDVSLDEMLAYLDQRLPWVRPSDTGRSTNCLINEAGIYVHKKERGYHNYAFPYSWDVRVGHKTREETLAELDDAIDEAKVQRILSEVGYDSDALHDAGREQHLVAYYVSPEPLPVGDLRAFMAERVPASMVPTQFVHLDALPLNATGKVDRRALPTPDTHRPELATAYAAPTTEAERTLARIWEEVLHLQDVGIHDNFFDLGGESILAIQISARAAEAGLAVEPGALFQHQTIAALAVAAGTEASATKTSAGEAPAEPSGDGPGAGLDAATLDQVAALLGRADRASRS